MILEHSSYRSFLKNVLADKKRQNPSYSMRAMALHIGLGQSALSQIISGKKNLSIERGLLISQKLNLNQKESEYFRLLIQIESTKNMELKKSLLHQAQSLNPKNETQELSVDLFSVISDWYHLAIKNMIRLKEFKMTPENISQRLNISKIEAEVALERLLRLEMIEADPSKKHTYTIVANYTLTQSGVPNEALRKFHKQMIQKAIESLESQTPREKFLGSETFAISEKMLPKAFALAEEFLQKMAHLNQNDTHPTQVYHVGLQLFNLTKGKIK